MDLLVYTVVGLGCTWLAYMAYMYVATRASEGKSSAFLHQRFPQLEELRGRALIYCFTPMCGPCRSMSKEVQTLIGEGKPMFKLDVTKHPDLSRELGIRAVPTLAIIENGTVQRMLLGVQTADKMRELLQTGNPAA